ncbi:MAG: anaerobic glycerol-3-phosphate dehydrogenase subunit C [Anaerolineales bacterium]|nr:anaerobic glycerol-3-phosphate dehydrogenase subunit C [Anaerolineales bacterium]
MSIDTHPHTHPGHCPVEASLDQCIKCNICTTVCPVSAVTDLFPGPKYEGPQAGRFRMPAQATPDHSVDYCSGCRACNMACPTGVRIAEINARARADMVRQGKVAWRDRLRNNLIARSELVGKLGQPVAPLANLVLASGLVRWATEKALNIHRTAPLPAFSSQRFTTWYKHRPRPTGASRQVVYFHGCSTQYYEPRVGRAAVNVLEANGFQVIVPPQNCCGLPLLSNGEFTAARRYHTSNVRSLAPYARRGVPIVGTSTSCTLTLKEEAPELLDMSDEDTRLVAEHTFDFNEFILELLYKGELKLDLKPIPLSLPYHQPCQYRAHRLGQLALEVLGLIPQLKLSESHATCCGIAGTYGYKVEKYNIAMDVGAPLFDFVRDAHAPVAICDSETCRWQISHATQVPAVHPVELLAWSYGFPAEGALGECLNALQSAS